MWGEDYRAKSPAQGFIVLRGSLNISHLSAYFTPFREGTAATRNQISLLIKAKPVCDPSNYSEYIDEEVAHL